MITDAWFNLKHHEKQARLWRTKARFVAVAAGRGSGKTELARRRVVRLLAVKKPWPDPLYFYALPTINQAKRVAWDAICRLVPKDWLAKEPNQSSMTITTKFGSRLILLGMDKPARAEGVQYDGGVIDECSDQKPGIFGKTFRPALTHKAGWCWQIGVPKRYGIGASTFKKFYDECLSCTDGTREAYTWPSSDILTPQELLDARNDLDERDFREQYDASWESVGGAIFYAFSDENIRSDVAYNPNLPILVGSDFNVNPMCWVLCHLQPDGLHVFDEIFLRNTNTQETLNHLYAKYGHSHKAGFEFYGDATARARKTAASTSDYIQIKNDKRFYDAKIFYLLSNPSRVNRFASCNALLRNANGINRVFISPRCKHLLIDLASRAWKDGIMEPDDSGDVGHITDAFGYIVHRRFPITVLESDEPMQVAA